MALTWPTAAIEALPLGGAGKFLAAPSGGDVKAVRALVGLTVASSESDPNCSVCDLALSGNFWRGGLFGLPRGPVQVSFFAQLANGSWEPGPVVPANLAYAYTFSFLWVKEWIVDRLREIAAANPPDLERELFISAAFPRAAMGMPAITVQLSSQAQASVVVGHLAGQDDRIGGKIKRSRQYSHSISIESWALTPEDRDEIARWMIGAIEMVMDAMRWTALEEPSVTHEESEIPSAASPIDFPIFQATARITATSWSALVSPVQSLFGRVAV